MSTHFERTAGTLHEISYTPCGQSQSRWGGGPGVALTLDVSSVDCPTCKAWLLKKWPHLFPPEV